MSDLTTSTLNEPARTSLLRRRCPQLQPKRPEGPRPSPHPPPPRPITLDPSKALRLSFLFIVKSRDVLMLTSWKCMADRLPRSQRASEWISQLGRTLEFSCRICSSNTVIATCKPFDSLLSFYAGANSRLLPYRLAELSCTNIS